MNPRRSQKTAVISAAMGFEQARLASRDHELDDLRREEPLQLPDPFQVVDLLLNTRLERSVQLRQFVLKPLDSERRLDAGEESDWSNGFWMKSSAPASRAGTFSWSPLAVIMITGRSRVDGSSRNRRQTS